ncbi:MAG: FmdB family zinc ribbon protein [Candidatus Binataceae bacterium]
MPIYEWNCVACAISFEGLAAIAEANQPRACPACRQPAGRIISACAIGSAASSASAPATAVNNGHPHGHHRRRSPIPEPARLCWMDDKSAQRFAAYKMGRGHEYDDKQAARTELSQRRGDPPTPPPDSSNSPVAQILARKKAKEAAQAAAASASTTEPASQ